MKIYIRNIFKKQTRVFKLFKKETSIFREKETNDISITNKL